MTDRDTLLAAILANPEADMPRLMYADAIEEDGEAERAEFIRREVGRVKQYDKCAPAQCVPWMKNNLSGWYWGASGDTRIWKKGEIKVVCGGIPIDDNGDASLDFRRGFLNSIAASATYWLAHADAILAAHPVQEVTLTTWPVIHSIDIGSHRCRLRLREQSREIIFPGNIWSTQDPRVQQALRAEWPTVKTWNLPQEQRWMLGLLPIRPPDPPSQAPQLTATLVGYGHHLESAHARRR